MNTFASILLRAFVCCSLGSRVETCLLVISRKCTCPMPLAFCYCARVTMFYKYIAINHECKYTSMHNVYICSMSNALLLVALHCIAHTLLLLLHRGEMLKKHPSWVGKYPKSMKSWENCENTESEICGNRESEMCGNTMRGNVFVADKVLAHYPEIACLSLPGK